MDKRIAAALVLVVVLAGIGWYVGTKRPAPVTQNPPAGAPAPTPAANPVNETGGNKAGATMNSAERQVLLGLPEGASAAEQTAYMELVASVAKDVVEVNVASCDLQPPVVKAHADKPFVFRNTGQDPVTISSGWITATIEAGKERSVTLKGGGLFGYGCGSPSGSLGGLVLLVP